MWTGPLRRPPGRRPGARPEPARPCPGGDRTPVGYDAVDDIKASLHALVDQGAQVQLDVNDVGGGKLTAIVTDGDGNPIGLIRSG
jgi:predicted enzyme related to lactoylglutathione lyase